MSRHTENTMKEIFKPIPGYEGLYEISNLGRVKSLKFSNERILKPCLNNIGYPRVGLLKGGAQKNKFIHRLVLLAFIGESELQVNHINGIKTDNRLENLEYCTASENIRHSFDTGLNVGPKGEKHGISKLTDAQARQIKYGHQGVTQQAIAEIYSIAQTQVSLIRLGKTWTHI